MSRRRSYGVLLVSAAVIALPIVVILAGLIGMSTQMYLSVIVCTVIGLIGTGKAYGQLRDPSALTLDEDGFMLEETTTRELVQRDWTECGQFVAVHEGWWVPERRSDQVVYWTTGKTRVPGETDDYFVIGGATKESIQIGYGRLSANKLADLLNAYRNRALER